MLALGHDPGVQAHVCMVLARPTRPYARFQIASATRPAVSPPPSTLSPPHPPNLPHTKQATLAAAEGHAAALAVQLGTIESIVTIALVPHRSNPRVVQARVKALPKPPARLPAPTSLSSFLPPTPPPRAASADEYE